LPGELRDPGNDSALVTSGKSDGMYIGLGTLVVIVIILLIVYLVRRV